MKKLLFIALAALLSGCHILPWPPEPIPPTPVPPSKTSNELLTEIQQTATVSSTMPDITLYEFEFEGGWKLQFMTSNVREIWGWFDKNGETALGRMQNPAGTWLSPNINRDIRHGALKLPNIGALSGNVVILGSPTMPVIDYTTPWLKWYTANGKTMYMDTSFVDVYTMRVTDAMKGNIGITTPMTSVKATLVREISQ